MASPLHASLRRMACSSCAQRAAEARARREAQRAKARAAYDAKRADAQARLDVTQQARQRDQRAS